MGYPVVASLDTSKQPILYNVQCTQYSVYHVLHCTLYGITDSFAQGCCQTDVYTHLHTSDVCVCVLSDATTGYGSDSLVYMTQVIHHVTPNHQSHLLLLTFYHPAEYVVQYTI